MNITVKQKLHKILKEASAKPYLITLVNRTKNVGIREYKKEIPVDKGVARNSVAARSQGIGYIISTTATNNGFLYPVAVHEGTMDFEGADDYGRRNVTRNPLSYLDSGRGIRPNKFADRARETTYEFAKKESKDLARNFERRF